jgi:HEPN domain-containing protein
MKADTREWVKYAEEDFDAACTLMRSRKKISANLIGFHCQQCVEKYLKARLEEAGLQVPKIHMLAGLLRLLAPVEPLWMSFETVALDLTHFAVKFRYPRPRRDTEGRQKGLEGLPRRSQGSPCRPWPACQMI